MVRGEKKRCLIRFWQKMFPAIPKRFTLECIIWELSAVISVFDNKPRYYFCGVVDNAFFFLFHHKLKLFLRPRYFAPFWNYKAFVNECVYFLLQNKKAKNEIKKNLVF